MPVYKVVDSTSKSLDHCVIYIKKISILIRFFTCMNGIRKRMGSYSESLIITDINKNCKAAGQELPDHIYILNRQLNRCKCTSGQCCTK